jgi:hypothetical protein
MAEVGNVSVSMFALCSNQLKGSGASALQRLAGLVAAVFVFLGPSGALAAERSPGIAPPRAERLQLKRGDHIAIIGNALPDRMQHSGYLETLIHAKFPEHDLVVRTLAVAGDEVVTRHRSENFGTPDEWLSKIKADVIFAFFGFNESFKGTGCLPTFRAELNQFLEATAAKDYSGKGAPRVV